jgi:hypothetical protein
VDPVTNEMFTAEKEEKELLIKTSQYYRMWNSNPSRLKKALMKSPVTVMVQSESPLKFYKQGVLDSSECGAEVDHALLAIGYG